MTNTIPPVEAVISPDDTRWAIAGKVPAVALAAVRSRLSEMLRSEGSRIVSGENGMSVLLVFGGTTGEGEDSAIELSGTYRTPIYLLDFDDEAYSVRQFDGARVTWRKGHPAKFLKSYGITPPGYGPIETPVVAIGVVDGATLNQARKALPKAKHLFTANSRGVLVNDLSGTVTIRLSRALKKPSFTVFYDREDETFSCTIWTSDKQPSKCFSLGMAMVNYERVDSILGETTVDGILGILDIPRHALLSDATPKVPTD